MTVRQLYSLGPMPPAALLLHGRVTISGLTRQYDTHPFPGYCLPGKIVFRANPSKGGDAKPRG